MLEGPAGFGPVGEEDLVDLVVGHGREAGQNILDVGVGIDPPATVAFDHGVEDGSSLSGSGVAHEEPVLLSDGGGTDGAAVVKFALLNSLKVSFKTSQQHPLNLGTRIHGHSPDWWSFASWQLHLMNDEHKCGIRVGVLRVDALALHVISDQADRLAQVFRKI